MSLGRCGVVGRFKPLHLGGARMLDAVCAQADHVIIGVGSSNKYNLRNPFTADESEGMIRAYLSPRFANYSFIHIPDYGHIPEYRDGQRWKRHVIEGYGSLDCFVSGNAYVSDLLQDSYPIIDSPSLIPRDQWIRLKASAVRVAMAKGDEWRGMVPREVAEYLDDHALVERFRREFGLETLASSVADPSRPESLRMERDHTYER